MVYAGEKPFKKNFHYITERLYWECQETSLEEGFTKVSTTFASPLSGFQLASGNTKTRTPKEMSLMDSRWCFMVQRYTPSQLTHKSDRLPALAGLAMTCARLSEDWYIVGCWQNNLPLGLLWTKELDTTSGYILHYPSWSWASFDGAVRFHTSEWDILSTKTVNLVEEIVVVVNGSTTAKIYGNVDEGLITLTGRIKATIFKGDQTENEYDQHMPWIMALDAEIGYVHKRVSFDSVPIFNSLIPILQLCAYDTEYERTEFAMLLRPLQQPTHCQRLGLGMITWKWPGSKKEQSWRSDSSRKGSWFEDAPQVRITIS